MNRLQLDRTEQIGVVLCSVAVMALIFLGMYVYSGPRKQYLKSREELAGLVDQIGTLETLKLAEEDRVEHQKKLMEVLQARPAGFSLFSHVDKVIGDLDLRQFANATNTLRGRETKDSKLELVSLSLRGVGLQQVLDVLHALYASNNLIVVQRMDRLAPSQGGNGGLDCELVLATLKT